MSMHNSIHIRKLLVNLAVNASFREPLRRILLHGLRILNLVLDYIVCRLHECWRQVSGHVEGIVVIGIAN